MGADILMKIQETWNYSGIQDSDSQSHEREVNSMDGIRLEVSRQLSMYSR